MSEGRTGPRRVRVWPGEPGYHTREECDGGYTSHLHLLSSPAIVWNDQAEVAITEWERAEARADAEATIQRLRDVEALARAFIRVRSAHNPKGDERDPYTETEVKPCAWCRLAAEQTVEAIAILADTAPEGEPLVPPPADPALFGSDR